MKKNTLAIFLVTILSLGLTAKASTFQLNEREYGNLQGGSLVVKDKNGQSTVVSIYYNSLKGFNNYWYCEDEKLCYTHDTFFIEMYNVDNPDHISVIQIANVDASVDLKLGSKARQFPVTRMTMGAFNVVGVAADLIASPFIWARNAADSNTDSGCADRALQFMRDKNRKGQKAPVSEQCLAHLIANIES